MKLIPPSTYDVLKTIQMVFKDSTAFDLRVDTREQGSFTYAGHQYLVTVVRDPQPPVQPETPRRLRIFRGVTRG